jgi:hypothetical protein
MEKNYVHELMCTFLLTALSYYFIFLIVTKRSGIFMVSPLFPKLVPISEEVMMAAGGNG